MGVRQTGQRLLPVGYVKGTGHGKQVLTAVAKVDRLCKNAGAQQLCAWLTAHCFRRKRAPVFDERQVIMWIVDNTYPAFKVDNIGRLYKGHMYGRIMGEKEENE